ncbi:MAG: sulfatase [Kiritimatiellae bacterium]|nr:sulfatase [Kiritimatiellia bacterium]
MRILYLDIDSLRADHLGCYGYHRDTTPNIDRLAAQGVRMDNNHSANVLCLPSRTALWAGRFGIHTGVTDHLGTTADHFLEGPARGFRSTYGSTNWMACLRRAGLRTVTVSSFAERHSIFTWLGGFSEVYSIDKKSVERADEVAETATDWIRRNARTDNWFLHVNFWDVHWPYRVPAEFGRPFERDPIPAWYSEEIRRAHWQLPGIQSAQDMFDFHIKFPAYDQLPAQAASMADVRRMFDGYDTSVRYVDTYIGRILDALDAEGVLDETAVIVSADHGECLGELNIYAGHRIADQICSRVPLVIRWPGITDPQAGRVDGALHYHFDWSATVIELAGGQVPGVWHGRSFADALRAGTECGRDYLVIEAGAGSCSRSVRFDDWLCIRMYHDCYQCLPEIMLFNVRDDPHEQHDLATARPEVVGRAMVRLDEWHTQMMRTSPHGRDPLWITLHEGGPQDTRGWLPQYLERLAATGRGQWVESLKKKYPREAVAAHRDHVRHAYDL